MPKDGRPRRRMKRQRRAQAMRDPATNPVLSGEDGMSAEQLVEHRELQVIREERYRKLAEARAALERERRA